MRYKPSARHYTANTILCMVKSQVIAQPGETTQFRENQGIYRNTCSVLIESLFPCKLYQSMNRVGRSLKLFHRSQKLDAGVARGSQKLQSGQSADFCWNSPTEVNWLAIKKSVETKHIPHKQ
jgi:hypothetical protein